VGIEELEFHIARTRDELEQALRFVYQVYERVGYVEPTAAGIRFGAHNLLPETRTFVATLGAEVVATVTLVFDSPLGLPMDSVYGAELDRLRDAGRKLVEVTMLADRRASGPRTLPVVLKLTKILFDYARERNPSDDLVIAVHPRHEAFYSRLLYFEPLGPLRTYAAVRDNPAVALRLDLRGIEQRCAHDERIRRLYFSATTPGEIFDDALHLTADDARYLSALDPQVLLDAPVPALAYLERLYPGLCAEFEPTVALLPFTVEC
jgi:hypothetical protein